MIHLLIALILAGAALYILAALPIDAAIKTIARVVIIVLIAIYVLWWLAAFIPALPHMGRVS